MSLELHVVATEGASHSRSQKIAEYVENAVLSGSIPMDALFKLHIAAIAADPSNYAVVNSLGQLYVSQGRVLEAMECFKQAIALCPAGSVNIASDNLSALRTSAVDRWHWKMLNDGLRNAGYRDALRSLVATRTVNSALDVGSGSGLLSLLCAEAGVPAVFAVEGCPVMSRICRETLKANAPLGRSVKLLVGHSSQLRVGRHLPAPVDLIVSELVDCGLLGERVLPTLRHSIRNHLSPSGVCVPAGATVHAVAVSSTTLRASSVLPDSSVTCGIPVSRLGVNVPYGCEQLPRVEHTPLSDVVTLFHLSLDGRRVASSSSIPVLSVLDVEPSGEMSCPVRTPGVLDAVVVWFTLHLTPTSFDEALAGNVPSCAVSSAPAEGCSWDQAVFYVKTMGQGGDPFTGFGTTATVGVGEYLRRLLCFSKFMTVEFRLSVYRRRHLAHRVSMHRRRTSAECGSSMCHALVFAGEVRVECARGSYGSVE